MGERNIGLGDAYQLLNNANIDKGSNALHVRNQYLFFLHNLTFPIWHNYFFHQYIKDFIPLQYFENLSV